MNNALCYRDFGAPEHVLKLESAGKNRPDDGDVRVRMLYAPVNASDLIPVTGAYRHRIVLPQIAGYEGVGVVTEAAVSHRHLIGRRVLPLRGEGTWQNYVDCPAALAVPVPEHIESTIAARGYINPVAAWLMLKQFSPAGKHVLITAAGSDCALQLGLWAQSAGALSVTGIHRSAVHAARLEKSGIFAVAQGDTEAIRHYAARASVVYDATGGPLAELILSEMPRAGSFVSYGLLSGQIFRTQRAEPRVYWFHIRQHLAEMNAAEWQSMFTQIWPRLSLYEHSEVAIFQLSDWQSALAAYRQAGRVYKPLIAFS